MNNCSASVSFTSRPTGSPPPDTHTSLSFSPRPFFLSLYPHARIFIAHQYGKLVHQSFVAYINMHVFMCVWARRGAVMHSWSLSVIREAARDSLWKGPTSLHHNSCLFFSDNKSSNICTGASGADPGSTRSSVLHTQNRTCVCWDLWKQFALRQKVIYGHRNLLTCVCLLTEWDFFYCSIVDVSL